MTAQATPTTRRRRRIVWWLFPLIVGVLAVGATKAWWPTRHGVAVRVLGEQANRSPSGASQTATGNSGCGNGNGGPNGRKNCENPGHPIEASGVVVGTLYPGVTVTLRVTVTNPNNQPLTLTGVDGTVGAPTKRGCLGSWFRITDFTGTQSIPKNDHVVIALPFAMLNESVNQDACKTSTVPVTFTATARN